MFTIRSICFVLTFFATTLSFAAEAAPTTASVPAADVKAPATELSKLCATRMSSLIGPFNKKEIEPMCAEVKAIDTCKSFKGESIFHYEKIGTGTPGTSHPAPKKVLVLSLIHGDEFGAGSVSRAWLARLRNIDPRNTWRMIPIVNPDGLTLKTRTNARKVDVNRNFPSKDWEENALAYWKKDQKSDPRRYPGPEAASEPETKCVMAHIAEFKPDFIISIHTPLGLLDFDGPRIGNPGFKPLPWVSLGNYPGSLGRYMWADFKVPVLTIELKGNTGLKKLEEFDRLQDITGTIAIQSDKMLKKEEAATPSKEAKRETEAQKNENK